MNRFIGHVDHKIDAKYRVRIPTEYRSQIEEGKLFFIVRPNRCIGVYPEAKCNELVEQLSAIKTNDPNYAFANFLVGSITEITEDDQGRIVIPNFYREYAGLSSECKVVTTGCIDHLEIALRKDDEKIDLERVELGFSSMPL